MVPSPWRPINTMTIAFGHGLSVSPLHIDSGVATVVNGGIRRPVTLLRTDIPSPGERVISERTPQDHQRLKRLVVDDGTRRKAHAHGVAVGGQTWTAVKCGRRRRTTSKT